MRQRVYILIRLLINISKLLFRKIVLISGSPFSQNLINTEYEFCSVGFIIIFLLHKDNYLRPFLTGAYCLLTFLEKSSYKLLLQIENEVLKNLSLARYETIKKLPRCIAKNQT